MYKANFSRNTGEKLGIMNWIQVKIITSDNGIEPINGMLLSLGITGVVISDKNDFMEFLENNRKYWDYVDEELERLKTADTTLTVYLSDDDEGRALLSEIKKELSVIKSREADSYGTLELITSEVKDEDWSENWKQYFKPIEVGEKILIVPEWEEIPDTKRTVFRINPGMSFGTGSHESTRMCIEEIEKLASANKRVLDLGCGSGILSVISLLLGVKEVTAVDIDPAAVEVSFANLSLNGLDKKLLEGFDGDITSDLGLRQRLSENKYDIVIANIVADVIIALSDFVGDFMTEDGYFVCSGIINERQAEVIEKLEKSGFNILNVRTQGEWTCVLCNKKQNL